MSAHDHTTIVPGCYRCDLNRDEVWDSMVEQIEAHDTEVEALEAERDRLTAALADRDAELANWQRIASEIEDEREEFGRRLADRDAQVTRVRALADEADARDGGYAGEGHVLSADVRRALDGAGDDPRPDDEPCICAAAGRGLGRLGCPVHAEPTGDEPPTEPRCNCSTALNAPSDPPRVP